MKKNDLLLYAFIFLSTFLVLQFFNGGKTEDPLLTSSDIGLSVIKDEVTYGKEVKVEIKNNRSEAILIPSECPDAPLDIYIITSAGPVAVSSDIPRNCDNVKDIRIEAGEKEVISYKDFAYSHFGEFGRYRIELKDGEKTYTTQEFEIKDAGIFTKFGRTFLYQPILNLLILILTYIPGHFLWAGIVILTIIIRTILLIPSQKAMRAQKRMTEVQPKLEEIKKKYANDQARMAQETMLIWKTHKVNPFSSCLPMLIQIPILIALYHVIQNGLNPDQSIFIYSFVPKFSIADINFNFLSFDLLEKSLIVFPLLVGLLQFFQIKLSMGRRKKGAATMPAELEMTNKMMTYFMPVMIAVFTASLPAAVGLYWGTSTIYGILQQLVVNRERPTTTDSPDEDVKVRVIHKNN